jgi:hypothetical protein
MRRIFIDEDLDYKFKTFGYVVLSFLSRERATELYAVFNKMDSGVSGRFFASMWSSDKEYRKSVDKIIKDALAPFAEKYLDNYKPFFSDLIVKRPSFTQKVALHQDWSFVDENEFSSLFIWCPLQDVNKRNGCLQLIPGSHKLLSKVRGSNIQLMTDYKLADKLEKKLISLEIKAGDVVVFNPAILHASPPNHTFKTRLCIGLTCVPEEAKKYHFHYNVETKKVEKLEINYDFIMNFNDDHDFKKGLFNGVMKKPKGGVLVDYLDLPSKAEYAASLEKILNT